MKIKSVQRILSFISDRVMYFPSATIRTEVRNYTTPGMITGIRAIDIDMQTNVATVMIIGGGIMSNHVTLQFSSGIANRGIDFRLDIFGSRRC